MRVVKHPNTFELQVDPYEFGLIMSALDLWLEIPPQQDEDSTERDDVRQLTQEMRRSINS